MGKIEDSPRPEPRTLELSGSVNIKIAITAPTILMSTAFWLYWAEIAIEHERQALLHRESSDRSDPGTSMMQETKASMVSLTACAHALDAFYGKFADQVTTDAVRMTWSKNRLGREKRIIETLKLGFRVNAATWRNEIKWLFKERRDPAVHHGEKTRPVVPHPVGVHSGQEMVDYSAEACDRAVTLMLDVLDKCTAAPKVPGIVEQCQSMRYQVEGLIQSREALKRSG
jgi:hypothetical protein